ncbi:hypothetical protein [Roseisolibacter sp. H3M3-2]|uniref:hypothetical protein n=1 Tax=Roseisolibacter sp. H3M3-2 TaxID=3031323 RepID=UPI0023DCB0F7|nr:hypothetical protein [Roseisolibacter sp. H3M3-2]MDF1502934.1 hypothetical protein [Roseisolibacter sp. H3M3-2]
MTPDTPEPPRDPRADHPQLADTASFPAARRPATAPAGGGDAVRPMDADEKRSVEITSGLAGVLAGAAAGAAAGLVSLAGGPVGVAIGMVVGATAGALGGWFGGQAAGEVPYDESHDAHYRALYEGGTPTDRGFDSARPAYQLGHLAAHNPDWRGREFTAIETDLRRAWDGDLRGRHGEWDAVRPYVRDAYGHARSEGAGVRRDTSVLGSAGSAVDPDELARARRGEPSTDYVASGGVVIGEQAGPEGGLGERRETDADTAHRRDPEYH